MTTTIISISICPASLEFVNGDQYDSDSLLAAIREFANETYPTGVTFAALQIGHRQGDGWAFVDGDDEAGERFLDEFFAERGLDEDLFEAQKTGHF